LAFVDHEHVGCVGRAIAAAEDACTERRLRLTPTRRRVLEILLSEHRAFGAYDVLARLANEGQRAHPPVAYRALDFLVENGFAHKIQILNAFVACSHSGQGHRPAFLICTECHTVAEAPLAPDEHSLATAAGATGFRIDYVAFEAEGLCPLCLQAANDRSQVSR
ncbi:MAG: Fur family transcriptional regulator, partial [Pseudomonadota bacterium]